MATEKTPAIIDCTIPAARGMATGEVVGIAHGGTGADNAADARTNLFTFGSDAVGDLYYRDSASTLTRLPKGSAGQRLEMNASGTAPEWADPASPARNVIINGAMNVWQRGTSFSTSGYTADQWYSNTESIGTVTRWSTSVPTGFRYSAKYQRTAGQTNTGLRGFYYAAETLDSVPLQGKTVTLSFWAKAGADYSPTSSALAVTIHTGTGADQATSSMAAATWTGYATPLSDTATLTTSWQRFSFTATLSGTTTQVGCALLATPTGTAGADDSFYVTGVQLEGGSAATDFEFVPIADELARCQRYYIRWSANAGGGTVMALGTGHAGGSTNARATIVLPVVLRKWDTASIEYSSVGALSVNYKGSSTNSTAIAINNRGGTAVALLVTTASVLTAGEGLSVRLNDGEYLAFDNSL